MQSADGVESQNYHGLKMGGGGNTFPCEDQCNITRLKVERPSLFIKKVIATPEELRLDSSLL